MRKGKPMERERKNSLKKEYLLIVLCCLVYSFVYAGRYGYNASITSVIDYYGVTRADAGLVSTFFFFAYGAGQFLHAVFCRFYPPKYVIPAVLLASSGLNLALFFLPPFPAIKFLWMANGILQSALWPMLVLILSRNLSAKMMSRAVMAMSLPVLLGTFLAYGSAALFSRVGYFRGTFLVGTVLTALIGLIWFFSYSSLTSVTAPRTVSDEVPDGEKEKRTRRAVGGALIALFAVCAVFAIVDNFVKDGLNTWTPVILKEQFGVGDSVSILMTLVLPVFGVFGSVLTVQMNRVIRDFRALAGVLYLGLCLCIAGLTLSMRQNSIALFLVCQGIISCLAHGINNVVTSVMPFALREKVNSGFLAGMMNASCYIGSTASAYGLGKVADGAGWDVVVRVLLIASVSATVLAGVTVTASAVHARTAKKDLPAGDAKEA